MYESGHAPKNGADQHRARRQPLQSDNPSQLAVVHHDPPRLAHEEVARDTIGEREDDGDHHGVERANAYCTGRFDSRALFGLSAVCCFGEGTRDVVDAALQRGDGRVS
eukprot:724218-Pyramimonas_sp.AAC.1